MMMMLVVEMNCKSRAINVSYHVFVVVIISASIYHITNKCHVQSSTPAQGLPRLIPSYPPRR